MQGGTGLRALSSNVTLAGTSVRGGTGASACGAIGCASCSASCGGPGGVGLWVEDSNVFVRGNAAHLIDGGSPGTPPEQPGISIQAVSSVLVESGVSVPDGIVSVGASILTPNPPEPFLTVTGDDAAGVRTVNLFGPSASPALLALSLVPDLVQLPGQVEGALWLQLSEILLVIPMVTQGQTIPATWQIAVPELPELAGLTGIFQALCPSFPGTLDPSVPLLTNAGQMVLH
jgi:hypothetical protein